MKVRLETVHRANQDGVPDLLLEAKGAFPDARDLPGGLDEARALHEANGRRVADALYATLPGGTLDQVLIRLLQLTASAYQVRRRPFSEG